MPGSRDYPTIATEAPPAQSPPGRKEEFRVALDRYMAFYAEQQRHHTEAVERTDERVGSRPRGLHRHLLLRFLRGELAH